MGNSPRQRLVDGSEVRAPGRSTARVTLTDVAVRAGVSRQTASRVARGGALVNAETAARVKGVIEELGYYPDPIARALSTGRTGVVGVLTPDTRSFGSLSIIAGVDQAAGDLGYTISIASPRMWDAAGTQEAVDRLGSIGCVGIIVMAPRADDAAAIRGLRTSLPLLTTSDVLNYDRPAIHPDSVQSAAEVVQHLLDLGHTTVRHITGPAGWNASRLRRDGWEAALRDAGAEVLPAVEGDWSARSGFEIGNQLLDDPRTTAIFAANDQSALGVIHAAVTRGLRVPEDVSVVGYDDGAGSDFFLPPLTTVHVNTIEQGRQVVTELMRQRDDHHAMTTYVPHELIIRSSTAPPRSETPTRSQPRSRTKKPALRQRPL